MSSSTITIEAARQSLVSGVYVRTEILSRSVDGLTRGIVETVRLDVDGWYPQMVVSGSFTRVRVLSGGTVHWIANHLSETSPGTWEGPIDLPG